MIYCERCGVANREGSRYCNGCGTHLGVVAADEEPLPPWLRAAAVTGYLWRGELLLPDWLSALRPFRELYGRSAVILPPPVSEVSYGPPSVLSDSEEFFFADLEDDETGAVESDLLVLDDLEAPDFGSYEGESETVMGWADEAHPTSPQASEPSGGAIYRDEVVLRPQSSDQSPDAANARSSDGD